MKGIILAGGKGTRLHPSTKSVSKQLLPVFDKPMIYYPLTTLMLAGIKDIALISTPDDLPAYKNLLRTGKQWGINLSYYEQEEPLGIAHAFIVCEDFIENDNVSLMLGDNIFYGNMKIHKITENFSEGSLVFGYPVKNPERYGVVDFDNMGNIRGILEKPSSPPSNYMIPGFYIYDKTVVKRVKSLKPSKRGELEITDLNMSYLQDKLLRIVILGRGIAWFDTGTVESLQDASNFISSIEKIQSYKVGCPEEVAIRKAFISFNSFCNLINEMPDNPYKDYLDNIKKEFGNSSPNHMHINNLQP